MPGGSREKAPTNSVLRGTSHLLETRAVLHEQGGGKGDRLGLGLSVAYEIIQRHGGAIDVESVLGRGTTMRGRLPIEAIPAPLEARSV